MSINYTATIHLLVILGINIPACTPGKSIDPPLLQETTIDNHTVTEINIEAIPNEVTQVGVSEFFEDFDVIRLESTLEALATNATLHFADNFFLLGTQSSSGAARVLRFDYKGNYLNDIGREGGGPGEHKGEYIRTLEFHEDINTILIDWGGLEDRQRFRPDGTHLGDVKMPMLLMPNIARWSENVWFSYGKTTGRPRYPRDSLKIAFFSSDGEIINSTNRTKYPPTNTTEYSPNGKASLFTFKGDQKIYFPEDHTIYRIEERELIPDAVIHPGKDILPFNQLTDPEDIIGKYNLEILSETDRNWFIKKTIYTEADFKEFEKEPGKWGGMHETEDQLIVIDKETNKGEIYKFKDDLFYILPEEFSKSLLPWQEGFGAYLPLSANIYLKFKEASKKLDHRSEEVSRKLEVLDDLTKNDNFVIFTFSFQDEVEIN